MRRLVLLTNLVCFVYLLPENRLVNDSFGSVFFNITANTTCWAVALTCSLSQWVCAYKQLGLRLSGCVLMNDSVLGSGGALFMLGNISSGSHLFFGSGGVCRSNKLTLDELTWLFCTTAHAPYRSRILDSLLFANRVNSFLFKSCSKRMIHSQI